MQDALDIICLFYAYEKRGNNQTTNKMNTVFLAKEFISKKCGGMVKNSKEPVKILRDDVETVIKFSYL